MITFGDSGWFGVISDEVGYESISIVAQAVADYLNDMLHSGPVVLGYDTRFLSREYAWSIQRVLTANRIQVFMHKKPVPTAFLSLSTGLYHAALGVMVTGEDRPARYSGLTFRYSSGRPVTQNWMDTLFQYLYRRYPRSSEDSRHLLKYIDIFPKYMDYIGKVVDLDLINKKNPFVASDSFFGSVGSYMQDMMKQWGINGIHIRTKPNPGFMDSIPQPNGRNMNPLSRLVAQKNGDIGLFFNGDGSTIGVASPHGDNISNLWVSVALLDEWFKAKGQDYDIYTEIFTPNLVYPVLSHYGLEALPLHSLQEEEKDWSRAVIWDRYGLTFGSFLPDRDGILQSLLLVQALSRDNLNWQLFRSRIESLTDEWVQEQKLINLDAHTWEKKEKALLEKVQSIAPQIAVQLVEEGEDRKICFQDGSWLGLNYNSKESTLFLYYDTRNRQKADMMLSHLIGWLAE